MIEAEKSKSVHPYGSRGVKILNMAYRVIVPPTMEQPSGSTEFLMLSFFDMTNENADKKDKEQEKKNQIYLLVEILR